MSLSPGERLGPYEVLGPIGAGGMGEVYRARDTRLDRTVALKVLPAELAADPHLKARFEREARAISALAHPNICTLHDVGEQDGQTFLVMEHLWPEFSPDGRWLAYASDDSGRLEVYVRPFPGPGPRTQVSVNGGQSPAWNPSGGELFFVALPDPGQPETRHVMVVEARTSPTLWLGRPRELFSFTANDHLVFACIPARCYDVSADGQLFFVSRGAAVAQPPPVTHIHLIQNWLQEVKARVPTD